MLNIGLSAEHVALIDSRIAETFAAWSSSQNNQCLATLARECYFQGLLDGSDAQVGSCLDEAKTKREATKEGEGNNAIV